MARIKAAIAGGTGYTAGELLRILINHPEVEICSVLSTTSAGQSVASVHRDLFGETELKFTDKTGNPNVLFLCLGHGLSREFLTNNEISDNCKIIDLGNDFRVDSNFRKRDFVYGLCDLNRKKIERADSVANPGCFATAIQLGILPMLSKKLIDDDIHVTAITGSTGAGKKPSETGHFSYRESNISVYKPFTHQHLDEINKTIKSMTGSPIQVNFVPVRGDFTRGIFASIYTECDIALKDVIELYHAYYEKSPFVFISDEPISLKEVINTNKCLIHLESHNGYLHITSIIDNLVKGASGQAVENMNLMFSLDETTGLKLKSIAF